jgi:flagellar biosynthetic protein FliR
MNELAPLAQLGLLLVRPGFLIMVAPAFGGAFAPTHVKVGLAVLLTLAMMPSVTVPETVGNVAVLLIVVREAAIGLALGLAARAVVAAAELAGHLSGFQLGLSYSAIIDPQSGVRNNLLAMLYANLAIIAFLLVNGHHAFLRALGASYERVPIGSGQVSGSLPEAVMEILGLIFVLGTRLALPLILVLIIVEVAMGLVSRVAPMLNLLVVGAPVRLAIGLIALGLMIPAVVRMSGAATDVALALGLRTAEAFR